MCSLPDALVDQTISRLSCTEQMLHSWVTIRMISVYQVASDVIEELCYEMGLQRAEALDEYAVFLVTHRGNEDRACCSYKQ